jgi:hypothetical protein
MNINGHHNGLPRLEKTNQGMKRLQIIALSAGIFAITGFGLSEWENVFHKATASGLIWNIQKMWHQSLVDTGNQFNTIWSAGGKRNREFDAMATRAIQEGIKAAIHPQHTDASLEDMYDAEEPR